MGTSVEPTFIKRLKRGHQKFRNTEFKQHSKLFERLSRRGQSPKALIISCCDSRVDPVLITNADPGDLFVVRNVANLVPPYQPDANYHGTSAALEFAVTGLRIEHIIVLGHARCGGIAALLQGLVQPDAGGEFIAKWMSIAKSVREKVIRESPERPVEARQRALEQASILNSLGNLLTFPFVHERVASGRLELQGWYFDIATGELTAYDSGRKAFVPFD